MYIFVLLFFVSLIKHFVGVWQKKTCTEIRIWKKKNFLDIYESERSKRAPHIHVYFQVSEITFLYELYYYFKYCCFYFILFFINSFTIAERCSVHYWIRNFHVSNTRRERTPQKYLDFMSQKVVFCFNYQSNITCRKKRKSSFPISSLISMCKGI